MSWANLHAESEKRATEAAIAARRGEADLARTLYAQAADFETRGLEYVDPGKRRTIGISAVSAVALWYNAQEYEKAQQAAHLWLSKQELPDFATDQLRGLLQEIWNELARAKAGVRFVPGQVNVSVKGGEVVSGGAPLDLILHKVQTVQSYVYRTAEYLKGLPHRKRGAPNSEIQEMFRPWLFQTPPGSYQFAVAIQDPRQASLFDEEGIGAQDVAHKFLEILRASVEDPTEALPKLVDNKDYEGTFLKLTRSLMPTGKTFTEMEVRSSEERQPIALVPAARKDISDVLRSRHAKESGESDLQKDCLKGILRALHLDKDWLEVAVGDKQVKVHQVGEAIDDVIGPMVNRPVLVETVRDSKGRHLFRDIELDD
jgi:hypothetical protein